MFCLLDKCLKDFTCFDLFSKQPNTYRQKKFIGPQLLNLIGCRRVQLETSCIHDLVSHFLF